MYKICSLFAGVGGIDLGFLETNKCEIAYANEFDKYAVETYENNFENKVDCRDIHNVKVNEIPEFDIMVGGFPCTSFSVAGYRKGFEDNRTGDLFFEMERIFKERKPRVIFLENVKNLVGHDKGNTFKTIIERLENAGYKDKIKCQVLNACEYGNIPQNRERIYIVAFREKEDFDRFQMPMPTALDKNIKDVKIKQYSKFGGIILFFWTLCFYQIFLRVVEINNVSKIEGMDFYVIAVTIQSTILAIINMYQIYVTVQRKPETQKKIIGANITIMATGLIITIIRIIYAWINPMESYNKEYFKQEFNVLLFSILYPMLCATYFTFSKRVQTYYYLPKKGYKEIWKDLINKKGVTRNEK